VTPERIDVSKVRAAFSGQAMTAWEKAAKRSGRNYTDTINRAIQTYANAQEIADEKGAVHFHVGGLALRIGPILIRIGGRSGRLYL